MTQRETEMEGRGRGGKSSGVVSPSALKQDECIIVPRRQDETTDVMQLVSTEVRQEG